MISFISKSEKDTQNFAKKIANAACEGDFFALQGGLGAGKTFFSKAFAKALNVADEVTSPTYTLICEYNAQLASGKKTTLFHLDLYRLDDEESFEQIGGGEYLSSNGICLVEWSEKIPSYLDGAILVRFSILSDGSRQIDISNAKFEEKLKNLGFQK